MKRFLILLSFTLISKIQVEAQPNPCLAMGDIWVQGNYSGDLWLPYCNGPFGTGFVDHSSFDGPYDITSWSSIPGNDWMLIIDEGFDNPVLDSTIWSATNFVGGNDSWYWNQIPSLPPPSGSHSLLVPKNLSISDSKLHIRGRYDPGKQYKYWYNGSLQGYMQSDYTSGAIGSLYQFPINSRYIIKMKAFPDPTFNGSSLWTYGNHSAEIDLIENQKNPADSYTDGSGRWQSMGLHGTLYGNGDPNDVSSEYADEEHDDLTANMHQYDMIWDKWKVDWYFDGNINRRITNYYYCDPNWTQEYLWEHMRSQSIGQYSDMTNIGNHCAVLKFFPGTTNMQLILGMSMVYGAPVSEYADNSGNSMDIDYVGVYLRTDCSVDFVVNSLDYGYSLTQYNGSTFEMGKTVTTSAGANILIGAYQKGVFAATDEIALLDGFGTDIVAGDPNSGANFHAFITTCYSAWDNREENSNTLVGGAVKSGINNQSTATTGIKDSINNSKLNEINISPNPTNGIFTLVGTIKNMPGQLYISIFDVQGNLIIPETQYNIGDKINISTLQNGVYNICIKSTSSTILSTNKKLIIAQ